MKPEIIPTSNTIQGLPPEGKLLVMRSDGTVENDWSVAQSFEGTTKDGTPLQFVEVTKPSEDGGLLSKTVRADTLLSWQVPETENLVEPNEAEYNLTFYADDSLLDTYERRILGLLSGTTDEDLRESVVEIVRQGSDAGTKIEWAGVVRNAADQLEYREQLAYWKVHHPEVYQAVTVNAVVGFHGTRSATLAGLIEQKGLISTSYSTSLGENGPIMTGGEHYFQPPEGQKGVSFSNLSHLDTAGIVYAGSKKSRINSHDEVLDNLKKQINGLRDSASMSDDNDRKRGVSNAAADRLEKAKNAFEQNEKSLVAVLMKDDFPVMIGIDGRYIADNPLDETRDVRLGVSSMGEFRPKGEFIPNEALPVIAVPKDRMESVYRLFQLHHQPVTVVSIEDLLSRVA